MAIQQKIAKIKGVADIVFCIDVTGSMENCINEVKANVKNFAASIKSYSANTKVDWRARILGYRDFNSDTEYLLNSFDFVSTPEELQSQLDSLTADGGGDEPESTLDAISYAIFKSNWRNPVSKIIVVFTDATPLPTFHSKTIADCGILNDFEVFKQTLMEKHIKLFLFGPKHPIYDELSKVSRTVITQFEEIQDGLKNADFSSIMDMIGKTVSDVASEGVL